MVTTNTAYNLAFDYREGGKVDSAYRYFTIAKDLFLKENDSVGAGKCLVNLAIFATDMGDYYGGIETAIEALDYFDHNNKNHYPYLNSNYINIGLANSRLKEYDKSIEYYLRALNFATDLDDSLICYNNIGKIYEVKGDFKEGIKNYTKLLAIAGKNNALNYARILGNLSYLRYLQNPNFNPVPDLLRAVKIRDSLGDRVNLNFVYERLSDYYFNKDLELSKFYATKYWEVSQKYNNPQEQLLALRKLVILSPEKQAQTYFLRFIKINDSLERVWSSTRNKFAMISYETELHKADKVILEKENDLKSTQIVILILGLLGIVSLSVIYIRRTKYIANLKAQRHIQENRLKTSKQVHDVVANGLYRVMSEIENTDFKKDEILDKLELMYEKSRDISYEDELTEKEDEFEIRILKMIKSFDSEKQLIVIEGDSLFPSIHFNKIQEDNLFLVLQELLINASKHSQASLIKLKGYKEKGYYKLTYTDNGIGLSENFKKNNGLQNTVNRINQLQGAINFVNLKPGGLTITLQFPIK